MVVWLRTPDEKTYRLTDAWQQCFYVTGDYNDLLNLANQLHIEGLSFERKHIKSEDDEPDTVLKIPVRSTRMAERLAERILAQGGYRRYELYNVDIRPSQIYMYQKGIYPFGYVKATTKQQNITWELQDSLESVDYEIPPLREIDLSVKIRKRKRIPTPLDPIESILIRSENEDQLIEGYDEQQILLSLSKTLKSLDPDIIYTTGGDDFIFPYLAQRASTNGVADQLVLGREPYPLQTSCHKGQTYMSYGRVHYRPKPTRIPGRIHIDREKSMFYRDCGLPGIIEVARLCRMPLDRVSNTTIGTSMTSAQLYEATRSGILIPWRKTKAEELKTARELLIADRGGFYYEPIIGLHESVGELDFTSLYPMIMLQKNLSGETVRCRCCPDSKNRVPELDYNICEKRTGIVPRSLKLIIDKRRRYKQLKRAADDAALRSLYEMRQAALKWILVCAFGYLGFKNARFGRIDAHIATCAFARKILKDAVHLAESRGFRLIHGIVDSLWLKKEDAKEEDYLKLRDDIEKQTGFPLSFEGIYRWIVFLPSRVHRDVPVLNRYYGVFRNGKIKDRGIATRRQDTPPIIKQCITEILQFLATAENTEQFYARLPFTRKIIDRYIRRLRSGEVTHEELVIKKHISKDPREYRHKIHQAIAANQLAKEGAAQNAGEYVEYIITNSQSRLPSRRVLALELSGNDNKYDVEAYIGLLLTAVETILMPFEPHSKCLSDLRLLL